jgi:hypothetical protein
MSVNVDDIQRSDVKDAKYSELGNLKVKTSGGWKLVKKDGNLIPKDRGRWSQELKSSLGNSDTLDYIVSVADGDVSGN